MLRFRVTIRYVDAQLTYLFLTHLQTCRSRRSTEYLFLGDHPGMPGMMDDVVEAGLLPASEAAAKVKRNKQKFLHFCNDTTIT